MGCNSEEARSPFCHHVFIYPVYRSGSSRKEKRLLYYPCDIISLNLTCMSTYGRIFKCYNAFQLSRVIIWPLSCIRCERVGNNGMNGKYSYNLFHMDSEILSLFKEKNWEGFI